MNPITPIFDRLVGLVPKPVLVGIGVLLAITLLFWAIETRPNALAYGFLSDPVYYALVVAVILVILLYYLVSHSRAQPRATRPGRVGVWLAQIEGEYLRDLRGQAEQELSSDPSLRDVDVDVLPRAMKDHDEAREEGTRLNAGAVVWGNLGTGLDERRVGNLKLTVVGGPMKLRSDVQVGRDDVDLDGYEMRDVARFVAGYALLSRGRPVEALVHFDRIIENSRPGLFDLSDALQFGGIACSLAVREGARPRTSFWRRPDGTSRATGTRGLKKAPPGFARWAFSTSPGCKNAGRTPRASRRRCGSTTKRPGSSTWRATTRDTPWPR